MGNEPELSELLPSSQGGANLDSRKQQKSSPSPIFASQRSPFPRKHQIIRLLEKKISLLNLLISETIKLQFYPLEGGGGYFTKFYTGRLCPEVQPLNLLHCIYTTLTKQYSFQTPSIDKWYPFHNDIPLHPFKLLLAISKLRRELGRVSNLNSSIN